MPPQRPVRRGQLISPFGVGAMVDFPRDESLMTAGLDAWPYAKEQCPAEWVVIEERLQARLNASHFRLPPDFRDPGAGITLPNQHVPFARFPRWHYCPRRGVMQYLPLVSERRRCPCREGLDCYSVPERRKPFLIPVRIVAVCLKGHIQDFPFIQWAHRSQPEGENHGLRFLAGRSSASLAGIKISCSCGKGETLAGAFEFDPDDGGRLHKLGVDCDGDRPWLGESGGPTGRCGEYLQVVQRGATNVYFPDVKSSIYLPFWAEEISRDVVRALENPRIWATLTGQLDDGGRIKRETCAIVASAFELDVDALCAAAQRKLEGGAAAAAAAGPSEEEFRRQEYEAVRSARGGPNTDLLVSMINASRYGAALSRVFESVALVRKLRETRVLAGFTRLLPPDAGVPDGRLQTVRLDDAIDWLPAIVVRGEGIFLEFRAERIEEWLARRAAADRLAPLVAAYSRRRAARGQPLRTIGPKFVMIHTLAHLLMTELSFECGYGSSSLRERIYCETEAGSEPMQGVLIYTASGDAEGTLGGLVRQGEPGRLERTLVAAFRRAQWCSSDPVCIESTGQGVDNANLAACHGCVLLPETSCEEGNRLLDRAMLVGTYTRPEIGFFSESLA